MLLYLLQSLAWSALMLFAGATLTTAGCDIVDLLRSYLRSNHDH